MDRLRDATRAVGAAAVLVTLLAAVPAALVLTVGWPLPTALPDLAEVRRALTGGAIGDGTIIKGLALVVWLAWLQVALAAGTEAVALARRRAARPAPFTLPGVQLLVGQLLSSALLLAVVLPSRHVPVGPLRLAVAAEPAAMDTAEPSMLSPAPATRTWTVQPRETLWGIAERALGDGRRFHEIAALNRGRLQPDGATFESPQAIRPGWVLQLPRDANATAGDPTHVVAAGESLSGIARDALGDLDRWPELWELNRGQRQPGGEVLDDPNLIRPGWTLRLPARPTLPASAPAVAPDVEGTPVGAPAVVSPPRPTAAAPEVGDDREATDPAPLGLVAAGIGLAGLVVALERRRRAISRHRSRGEAIAAPPTEVQRIERQLRAAARPGRVTAVDAAMHALTASGALAALQRVEADDDGARLYVDGIGEPPEGFIGAPDGGWVAPLDLDALEREQDPAPTLTTVGRRDGADVLVDLERAGPVTVSGPDGDVAAFLAAIAVDLAGAPWAEAVTVLTVGLPGVVLGAESTWDDAAATFADHADGVRERLGGLTLDEGRRAGIEGLDPIVVIGVWPPAHVIDELRASAGLAGAVVLGGAPPLGAVDLRIDGDSLSGVPGVSGDITPARIDADEVALLDELLAAPAGGDGVDHEVLDPLPSEPGAPGAADAPELPTATALLEQLDVLVRMFGPLGVVRLDGEAEVPIRLPRQKAVEAVAYLACRDRGVPVEDVRDALWPSGATSLKTLQNVVSEARATLGASRDGEPLLPLPESGKYQLSRRVGTDADVFRALVHHAARLPDERAGDVADLLEDGLRIVAGEPFVGAARGYAWVSHQRGGLVAEVVDAAEELAEIRLAEGDWRGAEWAARQGLRAFPCDERLYRLLMRAAHAAGNVAAVQRVFDELCAVVADPDLGVEPEDTVHPETLALLEELVSSRQSRAIGA